MAAARFVLISWALLLSATPTAARDAAVGVWQTEPDRKNLISQIEIRECAGGLCGKVLAAYDAQGKAVTTRNVGKELFWNMAPEGSGVYNHGIVWLPLVNTEARASMVLTGDTLQVKGCKLGRCISQKWTRLR